LVGAVPGRGEAELNLKYQIFVSSTYEDLRDERNEVIKACLNMGHIPVGMEMFNAADEEQWAVITRTIDQCDYYVVIVAHRYGSTTPDGVSFTEKEYDYAVAQGVPVLGFIIDESAPWPNTKKEEQGDALEALKRFKAKVRRKMVRFWHTASELRSQFVESLATTININPRRGWVRAPEATDVDIAQALSNLTEENARLRNELDSLRSAGARSGDTETIIAALKQFKVRRKSEEGGEETIDGAKLLPAFAMSVMARKSMNEILPDLDEVDLKVYTQNLFLMGLAETQLRASTQITKLTALGGIVYAALIAQRKS
jgi:nucleoside 2-deoxyribosyltransferase